MTFFMLLSLSTAKMSLEVGRAAAKVARAACGERIDPGWQAMDLFSRTFLLIGLSARMVVAKMALNVAETATDFAEWLLGKTPRP